MRIDAPYYSQRIDSTRPEWQWRACGVACVAMVLAHRGASFGSLDVLIDEGKDLGAYQEGVGWVHDGLVQLARKHGIMLFRKEFKGDDEMLARGIEEVIGALEAGRLVLVSAARGFEDATKPHLVLLTGYEITEGVVQGFFYHDPDYYTQAAGVHQFVSTDRFKRFWRRLAIIEG